MCHPFDATVATSPELSRLTAAEMETLAGHLSSMLVNAGFSAGFESSIPVLRTHLYITAYLVLAHVLAWPLLRLEQTVRETVTQIIQTQDAIWNLEEKCVGREAKNGTSPDERDWFSYVPCIITTPVIKDNAVFCWHTPGLSQFILTF